MPGANGRSSGHEATGAGRAAIPVKATHARGRRGGRVGAFVMQALARVAQGAPARTFVVEGNAPPASLERLRLSPHVQLVESPRSAMILLVAGDMPDALRPAVQRVHDAMALPRRTVVWRDAPADVHSMMVPGAFVLDGDEASVAARLLHLQGELLRGMEASEPPLLPGVEPAEWRGVGPFGQGGTGMTGGVPYGRPMAETAADRDGLQLDQLDVCIGPFFPPFPTGLVLGLKLQGDVIQAASMGSNPFAGLANGRGSGPFHRALVAPVRIAELEMARARHHLRWLAHALRVHGLAALSLRALALAEVIAAGDVAPVAGLRRALERTRALAAATGGVGVLSPDVVRGRGLGPLARASGLSEDVRMAEASYRALGFEPITQAAGDARARWRQRFAEAEQSIELAGRAGKAVAGGAGRIESPRGPCTLTSAPIEALLALVPALLAGAEWGDAVTALVSLDIDLRDLPPQRVEVATSDTAPAGALS